MKVATVKPLSWLYSNNDRLKGHLFFPVEGY